MLVEEARRSHVVLVVRRFLRCEREFVVRVVHQTSTPTGLRGLTWSRGLTLIVAQSHLLLFLDTHQERGVTDIFALRDRVDISYENYATDLLGKQLLCLRVQKRTTQINM